MGKNQSRKEFIKSSLSLAALPLIGLPKRFEALSESFFNSTDLKQDPELSKRVDELISKMTLREKISQMQYDAPAIPRLNIPAYNWWNEGLHGVARAGLATVFPQAIGMASTWNTDLMHRVSTAISDEARAKHSAFLKRDIHSIYTGLTFWSPNINLVRDPRWGRGQETYGEDPYLTGHIAVAFIRGMQGDDPKYLKLVATSKHFALYSGPEPARHDINVKASDYDLYDTYLPAFRTTIDEANVQSVMCAYNSFRGYPCCGNNVLLHRILREQWKFDGYVVSDCWAISDFVSGHHASDNAKEAAALALKRGTDLNCGVTFKHLDESVKAGLVNESEIDKALHRLFTARFRLGMFDDPSEVPFANLPYSVVDSEDHRQLALQMARESIVLLKNEPAAPGTKPILPLPKDLNSLAVIGPNADDYDLMLGNYHGTPSDLVTPLEAIRFKVSAVTEVKYAQGCELVEGFPHMVRVPSEYLSPSNGKGKGLYGEYFDNQDWKGEPAISRVDHDVHFIWLDNTPVNHKMAAKFSARWTGTIKAPKTGKYAIGISAHNIGRMYFEGERKIDFNNEHEPELRSFEADLTKGKEYKIKIEFANYGADPQIRLMWSIPNENMLEEAVEAAKSSDAVLMFLGLSPRLEGEEMKVDLDGFNGGDRTKLTLPETQIELIKKVQAVGKPTVLVLLTGSAVSFAWARDHTPAIIQSWYGGEAGGPALADVLFGDFNPGGRLPFTIYETADDLPPFEDYDMKNRTYRYYEGKPFYPFGYGLSYTHFSYSNLQLPSSVETGKDAEFSVVVRNDGNSDGDEVVQIYLSYPGAKSKAPIRALKGFTRIHLKPGESQAVAFKLKAEDLALVNMRGEREIHPGAITVHAGGKQPGFKGIIDASTTQVVSGTLRLKGRKVTLEG
ncbi:MAG TPA: glycoside hydrolase family 3 C-terminal domain-containing protein [Balneolales bacterium]|nr:glycoside hydrolase family 3 C-terminal domain-containing protein [Balneolales bacterium]